ncbi:ammonium transporter [Bremerella cremea]|uniref:ammonium transporter n=1 Tax=Bremerella cremea TaxID=1031537 RepID=UPI0031EC2B07
MVSSLSLPNRAWFAMIAIALGLMISYPLSAQDSGTPASEDAPVVEAEAGEERAEEAAEAEGAEEEEVPVTAESVLGDVDTLWTCLAAFLVFFMQAGFALVEAGFTRAKNACNIIMKNLMDFSIGSLSFWLVGFGLMFGTTNGFCGTDLFYFDGDSDAALAVNSNAGFNWAFLIFQTVFCATAATIVSGAMAERTKFSAYLVYSVLITVIVYPIFGSWAWGGLYAGGGWLEGQGFLDFAGSTVVHSIGGWCALAGAITIGPRIGKYTADGKVKPIAGHSIPLGALGVFILWLGWFGFNPGSTTAVGGGSFAYIAVTTNLAAAAGVVGAMITSWAMFGKPDTSFTLNGALAGLVSITAGCDCLSPLWAAIAGLIGGVLVVLSCVFFDKLKIDDPVGAVSVHGVCGAWGTLAVGLFMKESGLVNGGGIDQTITQVIGIAVGFVWAFGVSFVIFNLIKFTMGLRVTAEEEMQGLDIHEHGMYAYPAHLVTEGTSQAGHIAS